ncbi:flavin reductase [Streptomyces sp. NPDC050619]|uniref:flavin reductase n=1 Tax=Streptomyces sp. NPDC050619 TaxID=3157214 RepID=UPI0034439EC6
MAATDKKPNRTEFREAMAHLAAGVNILTTDGPGGRYGMTVSAVCSVTDTPPTILVCVNRGSATHDVVTGNRRVCVNVLGSHHEELAVHFSGATKVPMPERFDWNIWDRTEPVPVLPDALVNIIGLVRDRKPMGSHSVMFVEVERVRVRQGDSLVYFNRRFHSLAMSHNTPQNTVGDE